MHICCSRVLHTSPLLTAQTTVCIQVRATTRTPIGQILGSRRCSETGSDNGLGNPDAARAYEAACSTKRHDPQRGEMTYAVAGIGRTPAGKKYEILRSYINVATGCQVTLLLAPAHLPDT